MNTFVRLFSRTVRKAFLHKNNLHTSTGTVLNHGEGLCYLKCSLSEPSFSDTLTSGLSTTAQTSFPHFLLSCYHFSVRLGGWMRGGNVFLVPRQLANRKSSQPAGDRLVRTAEEFLKLPSGWSAWPEVKNS